MAADVREGPVERSKPDIREEYDGVKFRELMPGITTHPLIRSGRPCIEGTTIEVKTIAGLQRFHGMNAPGIAEHLCIEQRMVEDALRFYAAHTDYIDTESMIGEINFEQMVESHYGDRSREILSRRESVAGNN